MSEIGFLGLGAMGLPMAARLVEAGYDVVVWNRSPGPAAALAASGATPAPTPEEALARPLVVSMLANDAAVDDVFTAERLAGASCEVHINMASLSIECARDQHHRHDAAGIAYVAAPVMGRSSVAAAGQLNIVAAGPAATIDRVAPVLDVLGKRTWVVGDDPARANLVKIGVNYNLIHTLQTLGESVALMERGGVDPSLFVRLLTDTAYTGSAYAGYGPMIAERRYTPAGFSLPLGLKDLRLAEAAAAEYGAALPSASVLRESFLRALERADLAEHDWSAIAEVIRAQGS